MVKFPEAEVRKFRNVFICRKCKAKVKTPNQKVIAGEVTCRKCKSHAFRAVRKK